MGLDFFYVVIPTNTGQHFISTPHISPSFLTLGTVFNDVDKKGCVPVEKCPCVHNHKLYQPGESYKKECKQWWVALTSAANLTPSSTPDGAQYAVCRHTQHVRQRPVEVHKERLYRHVHRPGRLSLLHLRRQDVQLPRRLHLRPLQGEASVGRKAVKDWLENKYGTSCSPVGFIALTVP